MQVPTFVPKNKTVFIEIIILVLFFGGIYYLYTQFSEPSVTVSTTGSSQPFLGANSTLFLKAVNQDKVSFKDTSFMDSEFVKELEDFSETILMSTSRGRVDPFTPYAPSRSIR